MHEWLYQSICQIIEEEEEGFSMLVFIFTHLPHLIKSMLKNILRATVPIKKNLNDVHTTTITLTCRFKSLFLMAQLFNGTKLTRVKLIHFERILENQEVISSFKHTQALASPPQHYQLLGENKLNTQQVHIRKPLLPKQAT